MPPPRALVLLGLLAALACGREETVPAQAPVDAAAPAGAGAEEAAAAQLEVATLREALASEYAEREALEAEIERLREALEDAELAEAARPAPDRDPAAPVGAKQKPWFDAEALAAHGVAPDEVERVREAFDQSEMALLELEDRARREGWQGSPRYREALRDERGALRDELGDEGFDRLLYASGRPNRVVVAGVLGGSPAERAGIRPGDEILSYDGKPIFRAGELKTEITNAPLGATVAIVVVRDGSRVQVSGYGGPLGIQLSEQSRPPR